jgi:hypothetical protein
MFLAPPKASTTFCSTLGTGSPVSILSKNGNSGPAEVKGFAPVLLNAAASVAALWGNKHHFAD